MTDLIDREALLWEYKTNNKYTANAASLAQCIYDAQTFDAVEVVRCIDCIHFRTNNENDTYCIEVRGITDPEEDDYCSYGERKENETD